MKIPKSFQLFGTTIKVVFDDKFNNNNGSYGIYDPTTQTITLTGTYKDSGLSKDMIESVFFHEVIHAILGAMNQHELSQTEEFTQVLSQLFHQFIKTQK